MKFYTYTNPNNQNGRTDWGEGLAGEQLERLSKLNLLAMRSDVDEEGEPLNTGHAVCLSDESIIHLNFVEVNANSPDGEIWWNE